jgi:hypothetical protein
MRTYACVAHRGRGDDLATYDPPPLAHKRSKAREMNVKEDYRFGTPEAAERKLLELADAIEVVQGRVPVSEIKYAIHGRWRQRR